MMKKLPLLLLAALTLCGCGGAKEKGREPMCVIFETDAGNDVDDAQAMDMLYKYMDDGLVEVLAVCTNKKGPWSPEFIDLMNVWYGYPDIPVGKVAGGVDVTGNNYADYAEAVCRMTDTGGNPLFPRSKGWSYEGTPEATELYRRVLASRPDNSVTVISVGFSTNLIRLLDTPADKYSKLTGRELVAKKVRMLAVMAGSFGEKKRVEYNVRNDIPAAQRLFAEWPGEIRVTPFEIGLQVKYPGASIENDFGWAAAHPMVEAYKSYQKMPYDRPTWDLISVLDAVEPDPARTTWSGRGVITVDDEGYTRFAPSADGPHSYITATDAQAAMILDRFRELITRRPKRYAE